MWNDPVPISPAEAAGLNQSRLVGQDAFGLLQGEGVFVDDGVVAGGLFVFGDPQQGVDALGRIHHVVGGAPQPGQ